MSRRRLIVVLLGWAGLSLILILRPAPRYSPTPPVDFQSPTTRLDALCPEPQRPQPSRIFSRPADLAGIVFDSEGRPLPGARVRLIEHSPTGDCIFDATRPLQPTLETLSDETGRFRFQRVRPGSKRLIGDHPAHAPTWGEPFDVAECARHEDLVLRLWRPGAIEGRVNVRARVSVAFKIPGLLDAQGGSTVLTTVTDESGRFRIDRVPPSTAVQVKGESRGYRDAFTGPFVLAEGGAIWIEISLERGLTLIGRVTGRDGRGLAGARLVATQGEGRTIETRSADDGSFALEGLSAAEAIVMVTREGYASRVLSNVPVARPLEISLEATGSVSGRVVGAARAYVCYTAGHARYRKQTSEGGDFRLESVPAGAVRLDVEDESRRVLASFTIDIEPGASMRGLDLRVP